MYKGCWLKAQTKSMVIPDANLTNDMELLHTGGCLASCELP